jgi:hypothetical protein
MQQIQAASVMAHAARVISGVTFYQAQWETAQTVITRLINR